MGPWKKKFLYNPIVVGCSRRLHNGSPPRQDAMATNYYNMQQKHNIQKCIRHQSVDPSKLHPRSKKKICGSSSPAFVESPFHNGNEALGRLSDMTVK
jgi:hypothetical protein